MLGQESRHAGGTPRRGDGPGWRPRPELGFPRAKAGTP